MTPTIAIKDQPMNCLALSVALGFSGPQGEPHPWVVYGIKKANRQLAEQGAEVLIFCGRYSTPAKVLAWLQDHPGFVANKVLDPKKEKTPAPHDTPARLPA